MNAKMAWVTFCAVVSCWPVAGGKVRFYGLTTPLSVGAQKKQPPYLAFAETIRRETPDADWEQMSQQPSAVLSTESAKEAAQVTESQNVVKLEPLRIEKAGPDEDFAIQTGYIAPIAAEEPPVRAQPVIDPDDDGEWIGKLPMRQRERVLAAQARGARLAVRAEENDTTAPVTSAPVAANEAPTAPAPVVVDGETEIAGHLEVSAIGFLGRQYNQHFEILNEQEGIVVGRGEVNAREATYRIRVRGRTGRVIARLNDESGKPLGQDEFYLSQIRPGRGVVKGPTLKLRQQRGYAGQGRPLYPAQAMNDFKANVLSERLPAQASRDGEFEVSDIQKGSMTVLRAQARHHARTIAIVPAGYRSDLTLFPKSWVDSLKRIVSEQRRANLEDEESPVVWGRVVQDGRARAGVNVQMESAPDIEVVYFNQLLLPDPDLKSTSENGLFAFIGPPEGFHSLIARVGDAYLAHENVVVENGAVTLAGLESTLRTEPVNVRVYDAFQGTPQSASVVHQAVEQEIEIPESGTATVSLPVLRRLSLAQVRPESPYSAASYLMNDDDGFVHLPLVRADWLRALQGWAKISDVPDTSVVVGFVPDEDFAAEAVDSAPDAKVIYFNARGEPVPQGQAGGGFVVFGLSAGVREIIVSGARSKLLATRVVPADPRSMVVLTYRAD